MKQNNQNGFGHLVVLLMAVLIAVGAVGVYVVKSNNSPRNSETSNSEVSLVDPLPSDIKTVDEIRDLVKAENPDAVIDSVELEEEDGALVFRVELADGSEMIFNAETGAVVNGVKNDNEAEDQDAHKLPSGFVPALTFDQAREKALLEIPNGTIQKIKLLVRNDEVVYKVYFENGGKVEIDATTGDVIKVQKKSVENKQKAEDRKSGSSDDSDTNEDSSPSNSDSRSESRNDNDTQRDDNSGHDSGDDNSGSDSSQDE